MTTAAYPPPLPSVPEQEARALGNILIAIDTNPTDAREWTARLRAELFTEHSDAFVALHRITAPDGAFTIPGFVVALAEVSQLDHGTAAARVSVYTDTDKAAGIAGDFNEALQRLEESAARRELMRDAFDSIARAQSGNLVPSKSAVWEWPDLDPGPFPIDSLPSVAGRAASTISETHALPLELAGMVTVATLGAACGKGWRLSGAVLGRSNFANIFVLAGAERGVGKGSCGAIVDPLMKVSAQREEHWQAHVLPGLRTDASIAKRSADAAEKEASGSTGQVRADARARAAGFQAEHEAALRKIDGRPVLWAGDCTSQKLGVLLGGNRDESLLIYSPEAGAVIRNWLGRYDSGGKADVDLQLSGYSCEPCKVDRIGRASILLRAPCLSALLMVQPILVRELFSNDEVRERGLLARTMCFTARGNVIDDDGITREPDRGAMDEWTSLIGCLLRLRHDRTEPLAVRTDAGAEKVFREFHNEIQSLRRGALESVSGDLTRWRENACRVALAIHAAEDPEGVTLTTGTAERAVRLVRWAGRSTVRLLASGLEAKAKARAEKLRGWLQRSDGRLTLGALAKKHGMEETEAVSLSHTFPAIFAIEGHNNPNGGPRTKTIRLVT